MKILFVFASLLLIQASLGDDGGVTTDKKCEDFLSTDTCNKLRNLASLLHEKASIVSDAVKSAVAHHKTKATEMLAYIKNYMAVNMKCDTVLPANLCTKLLSLGQQVKLTSAQVKLAIENAVASGVTNAQELYQKAVEFMTTEITCAKILGDVTCNNLVKATQLLKEQSVFIKEAIMAAYIKHTTNIKDVLKSVKDTLVAKATNFTCTDVLTQQQCDFLGSLAKRFRLKTGEVHARLALAIANGFSTVKEIYDTTIGELIEDAKNLKCEDLIAADYCNALDAFAANFNIQVQQVTLFVKVAIANGKQSIVAIVTAVRQQISEKVSCDNFLGKLACNTLETLATTLHVNFHKVIEKMRTFVADGVTSVRIIRQKITSYIWSLFFGNDVKRSLGGSLIDMIKEKAKKMIDNLSKITADVKEKMKAQISKVIDEGKMTLKGIKIYIDWFLINFKEPQQDDELSNDAATTLQAVLGKLKETIKKAHGNAKALLEKLLKEAKERMEKLKELLKKVLGNQDQADKALELTHQMAADMAYEELDEEVAQTLNNMDDLLL